MKPLFKCELHYFPSPHLYQIYNGFEKLRKLGIIDLSIKRAKGNMDKPLLNVTIDNRYNVIYDTLDGFNWVEGSVEENLEYFKNNLNADFYFKRSFSNQLRNLKLENCKIYPLGLNYTFRPEGKYPKTPKEALKDTIKNNPIISKYYKKTYFTYTEYEHYPIPSKENKILFLARLWNPDEVSIEHLKAERERINNNRMNFIKFCRDQFGSQFVGGLQIDDFSTKHAKDLVVPNSLTNRGNFNNIVKSSNICIATTGLHNSIGWKFGEYVAAYRAIISEPLEYDLPGNFLHNKNYLAFQNENELITNIDHLLKEKDAIYEMMKNNFQYYNNYLSPDKLVLNTILKIYENQ
ncbi:hypothetical protein V5097_15165 [Arenibacter palladensis]|uniref:hypothetical protein n=1 Tax=Arenibacter palladensis TaxID=237373 RepID=UPI002FD3B5D4